VSDKIALHLERLLESATQAQVYLQGMTREAFLADRRTQQAVVLNLMVIGETVNRLHDDDLAFLERHSTIPWAAMRGMRNRIAHGYFDIDMNIVWETVQRDLPALVGQLAALRPGADSAI
jgi:uncharacterized protein with HEPN domain